MIDRILLLLKLLSSENEFYFFYSGVLKTHKAGKDLYFKYNIKNEKGFILSYDDFYNQINMKSELVYTETSKSGIPNE